MSDNPSNHASMAILASDMEPKKAKIVETAMQVFIDNGFNQTSMNDIVAASGLSKGGVYHYFSKKDDVIMAVMDALFASFQAEMMKFDPPSDQASDQPSDAQALTIKAQMYLILEGVLAVSEQQLKISHFFFEMYSYSTHHEVFKQKLRDFYLSNLMPISDMIEAGIATGEFKAGVNANAIAVSLAAIFDGVGLAMQLMSDEDFDYSDNVRQGATAILDGISV